MSSIGAIALTYLSTFSIITTFYTAFLVYSIWKMGLAGSFTWSMLFMSNAVQLFQLFLSLYFIGDVSVFLSKYPVWLIMLSFGLTTLNSAGYFIFAFNIYKGLKRILPPGTVHG